MLLWLRWKWLCAKEEMCKQTLKWQKAKAELIAVPEGGRRHALCKHWASTQGKISEQCLSHTLGLGSWDALRQCKVPVPRYWTYWVKKYILVCVILCPLKAPFPPPGGGWIMSLELYPRIHAPNTRDFGCTQHLLAIMRSLWVVFAFSLWVLSRLAFSKVFCCIWFYSLS